MRIPSITATPLGAAIRLSGAIRSDDSSHASPDVYVDYHVPDPSFVRAAPEAIAAAVLLPAMRAGESLEIIPAMSPRLCFNLPRIRDIFHRWWPEFARIQISTARAEAHSERPAAGAATFFSGGVDSFYTLLKHRAGAGSFPVPLTHILFMRGVETRLERTRGVDETERWIREVAYDTGVDCVMGETNLRTSLQREEAYLHWERHYHGSALAAIGLALSPAFAFVCIPSAFSYNHLVAHGSTPLVDEMYSSEATQIVHDGAEVSRAEKVAKIIEWHRELVLRHLRVCIKNRGGAHNCGRCYKCVRTAVPLRVLGVWDRATTFPDKSTGHWENIIASDHEALTVENLRFAIQRGADAKLISMLRNGLNRRRRRDKVRAFVEKTGLGRARDFARHLTRPQGSRKPRKHASAH